MEEYFAIKRWFLNNSDVVRSESNQQCLKSPDSYVKPARSLKRGCVTVAVFFALNETDLWFQSWLSSLKFHVSKNLSQITNPHPEKKIEHSLHDVIRVCENNRVNKTA